MNYEWFYWIRRQRALGRRGNQESKEETLLKSIDVIQKHYTDFEPEFDKEFFKV